MANKLYIVHGSHPCATVEKALQLKGIGYKVVELTPPAHAPIMRMRFGARTVPGIRFEDGEKVQGSRAILKRLEAMVPEPALYGDSRIEEAEAWGDAVIQPIARRVLWPSFQRNPRAMHSYQQGQRLPKLPAFAIAGIAPVVTRIERRMNKASEDALRQDLQELPSHLDKIDAWIADGVLGGDQPNAADLQIAPTLRLLWSVQDVRPLIAGRPAADLAHRWLEPLPGSVPAGTLPSDWIPAPAQAIA